MPCVLLIRSWMRIGWKCVCARQPLSSAQGQRTSEIVLETVAASSTPKIMLRVSGKRTRKRTHGRHLSSTSAVSAIFECSTHEIGQVAWRHEGHGLGRTRIAEAETVDEALSNRQLTRRHSPIRTWSWSAVQPDELRNAM